MSFKYLLHHFVPILRTVDVVVVVLPVCKVHRPKVAGPGGVYVYIIWVHVAKEQARHALGKVLLSIAGIEVVQVVHALAIQQKSDVAGRVPPLLGWGVAKVEDAGGQFNGIFQLWLGNG